MITDSIQACMEAIKQTRTALKDKQSLEEYQKTLTALGLECQALTNSLNAIDGINEYHVTESAFLDSGLKNQLLEDIDQCGSMLENGQLSKETVQVLSSHARQLQRDLTTSWKASATHFAEGISGYLGIIRGLSDNPSEVDEIRDSIDKLTYSEPSASSAKKLYADVTQAKEIISEFSLKPEIEVFLRKVAAKQATISDITPEVLSWLETHRVQSKLRISF